MLERLRTRTNILAGLTQERHLQRALISAQLPICLHIVLTLALCRRLHLVTHIARQLTLTAKLHPANLIQNLRNRTVNRLVIFIRRQVCYFVRPLVSIRQALKLRNPQLLFQVKLVNRRRQRFRLHGERHLPLLKPLHRRLPLERPAVRIRLPLPVHIELVVLLNVSAPILKRPHVPKPLNLLRPVRDELRPIHFLPLKLRRHIIRLQNIFNTQIFFIVIVISWRLRLLLNLRLLRRRLLRFRHLSSSARRPQRHNRQHRRHSSSRPFEQFLSQLFPALRPTLLLGFLFDLLNNFLNFLCWLLLGQVQDFPPQSSRRFARHLHRLLFGTPFRHSVDRLLRIRVHHIVITSSIFKSAVISKFPFHLIPPPPLPLTLRQTPHFPPQDTLVPHP